MLVLDLHPWEKAVVEGFHILEGLLLIDVWKHIEELVKVGADEVDLLVAVEPAHLGTALVDGLLGGHIGELEPNCSL